MALQINVVGENAADAFIASVINGLIG